MQLLPIFDVLSTPGVRDHVGLTVSFLSFMSILLYHTRHQVPIYHRKFHKKKIYLYVHIFTGLSEAFKLRFRKFHGQSDILPDALDVLTTFIWSWTTLELTKTLRRGDPRTTRPAYQAGACLRTVAALISYLYGIPSLHSVSVHALDGFIFTRLAITYFVYAPFTKNISESQIYAISVPLAGILTIFQSQVHSATLLYLLATAYITKLNDWVSHQSQLIRSSGTSCNNSKYFNMMIASLMSLGFVELEELRAVAKITELEKPLEDEFVSEHYSNM